MVLAVREGLTEKVAFKQRLEDIGKQVCTKRKCKGLEAGLCLVGLSSV